MEIIKKIAKKDDFYTNPSVTIAFIGDSVTHGCFECYVKQDRRIETIFEMGSSYTNHVKTILNTIFPRSQVNIISSGLSGDFAVNGAKRFERDALNFNPDLVVISYGLNDACMFKDDGIKDYSNAIREMVRRAREKGAEVIFMSENYMCTSISDLLPREEEMIASAKYSMEIQNSGILKKYFDEGIRSAREEGAKVLDMYSTWETMANAGVNPNNLLSNKMNHPIRDMHKYMAIKLVEKMFEE